MDKQSEPFFTATTIKLIVMSLCTFGFYEYYWFYKNWQVIKKNTSVRVWPSWRATFSPFYAYGCFNHIKIAAEETGIDALPPVHALAIIYLGLSLLSWTVGMVSDNPIISCLATFSFLSIIPVNSLAVSINERQQQFKHNGFTLFNWLVLIFGGFFIMLNALSTLSATECYMFRLFPQVAEIEATLDPEGDAANCLKKGK